MAKPDIALESLSDQQLLQLLAGGSQPSYTVIYARYSEVLFRHACNMLEDRAEAEDVIQEVFLMLWTKRSEVAAAKTLSAYLYTSVRNRILNHITHQKVVDKYLDSMRNYMEAGAYTADELLRGKELAAVIERELEAMPPKMREIFLMSRNEQLSHKSIGELLNISDKTVKQQVYKAVKQLRGRVENFLKVIPLLL
ncbi:RNA polymerase sigma-70 factor [Chitinophaga sancti]|uniref:RNA polymerase sigma-70 factor n=1 Tax=Chitinophaga sancti TaxID=1004 RepID=A0A1K1SJZ9_9BACT|nr:RNA polymerase sigma-70 factor [Chitinophaga sancti]WQD64490.1 RNA polymerase sigma-70 factor [Chitinophaga sancti]WQG89886.1 RNA polymerase sigma-70 factor [Chitinophaga sancti]SFW84484.1 RNA polymerase sigma-70 factor, ECF subfamily [Chitinophaga sancti]